MSPTEFGVQDASYANCPRLILPLRICQNPISSKKLLFFWGGAKPHRSASGPLSTPPTKPSGSAFCPHRTTARFMPRRQTQMVIGNKINTSLVTVGCANCVAAQIWDSRRKLSFQTLQNMYQVTSVCFSDTAEQVISGGIDNDVKVYSSRRHSMSVYL